GIGLSVASIAVVPVLVFVLTIAEQGMRLGRSTHVVDMADEQRRGAYTALSNTISGVVMLGAGVFGFIDQVFGGVVVLVGVGGMYAARSNAMGGVGVGGGGVFGLMGRGLGGVGVVVVSGGVCLVGTWLGGGLAEVQVSPPGQEESMKRR